MNHNLHVIIPMSGQGTRYQKAGYTNPKPMIPVNGKPMILRLLGNFLHKWNYSFVMNEDHRKTGLEQVVRNWRQDIQIDYIESKKLGPSYAVLKSLEKIPDHAPVLVSYCDYGMVWDAQNFEEFVFSNECDACLISYRGFHAHYLSPTNYAFSRMQGERVVEVKEKGNFTDNRENEFASGGAYYFKSAKLLKKAIDYQMKNDLQMFGEYYTSLTVQALLQLDSNAHVRIYEVPYFFQWGTPDDLQIFEYWEKTYQAHNKFAGLVQNNSALCENLIMPMAGRGERFAPFSKHRKPMIPVNGIPMFKQALNTLPQVENRTYVALDEFSASVVNSDPAAKMISLKETPQGQALSTELGAKQISNGGDILISSCDHGIVLDPKKWASFKSNPQCEAAIFTVKGFPGTVRKPTAFSFVATTGQELFPVINKISVKKALTENPRSEPLLVGSFWVKNKDLLLKAIDWLKTKDIRVNNELYLDSAFQFFIENGMTVREIPLDGYVNWGDPDSLAEALYWQEAFLGHGTYPRQRFPGGLNKEF